MAARTQFSRRTFLAGGATAMARLQQELALVKDEVSRLLLQDVHLADALRPVVTALVVGEDRRFYWHPGFDPIGMAAAVVQLVRTGRLRGASTIEQQLVRTIRQRYEITLARKMSEIYLSIGISAAFSKDELARAYLLIAYFGWGGSGVVNAARRAKIPLDEISTYWACYLIAMLKYPLPKHPTAAQFIRVEKRARHICRQVENGAGKLG